MLPSAAGGSVLTPVDARAIPIREHGDVARPRDEVEFLSRATSILSRSLDIDETLSNVAAAAVPGFADWCAVDLVEPDGRIRRVAVAHPDPDMVALAHELQRRWPPDPAAPVGVHAAVRTGRSQLVADIPPTLLDQVARDAEHRSILERLALRSLMVVPIPSAGGVAGAITFVLAGETLARYGADDLALAEELARRAAVAVDRARLFTETRQQKERLRALVDGVDAVVWEMDAEGRFTFVSQRAATLLATSVEACLAPGFWRERLHPLDTARVAAVRQANLARPADHELEYRLLAGDGRVVWVRDVAYVDRGAGATLRGILVDVTQRRSAEGRLAAQLAVSGILHRSRSLDEATPQLLAALGEHLGWEIGAFWRGGEDGRLRLVEAWHAATIDASAFLDVSRAMPLSRGVGLPGRVLASAAPAWIEDVVRDANFPRAPGAAASGLHAAFAFPVRDGTRVHGVLEFLSRERRPPDEALLALLDNLGAQVGEFVERRAAEEALRLSNARRGAILESALDAIVTIDAGGRITEFNPAAEAIFGYARDEAIGRELADLIIPPEHRDAHRAGLARVVSSGRSSITGRRLELTAQRKDGTRFASELAIVRIPGEPASFTGFLRDISERRAAEEEVRDSEARYRSLVEATANVVFVARPDGALVEAENWTEFTGALVDEALGEGWLGFVVADERDALRAKWRQALAEGTRLETELGLQARGGVRHVHLRATPVRRDGVIREWVAALTDITQRRAAEAALRESEHRYGQILDSVRDMVFTKRPGAALSYANKATRDHYGETRRPVAAASEDEERAFRTGETVEVAEEVRIRHDGEERIFHTIKTPIFDTHGNVVELVGVSRDITERKRAERAVAQSEERFRLIARATNDVIWDWDLQTNALWWNESFESVFGEKTIELEPDVASWMRRIHPDDAARVEEGVRRAIEEGRAVWTAEYRFRRKDGTYAHVLDRGYVLRDANGRAFRMIGSMLDITERKRTEERLSELLLEVEHQRARLDNIIASVPGVVWEAWGQPDAATQRIDFVSEFVEPMLGYSREEWLATPNFWLSIVHPDDRERAGREAFGHFVAGKGGTLQFRWRRKDGTYLWAQAWNSVILDADGRPVGMRGVTMDITPVKLAEEALRRSEESYRFLADSVPEQVWTARPDGRFDYVNRRLLDYFGLSPDQLMGLGWERLVHPDDLAATQQRWTRSLESGEPFEVEFRLRRADGIYRWHTGRALPQRDERGGVVRWFGASSDITDHKAAQEALAARAEDLSRLTDELRYQAQLVRIIADNAASALFMMDKEGRPVYVNPAAMELTGYGSLEEIKDRPLHYAVHFKRPDGSPYPMEECPIDRANATVRALKDQREVFCRKDGTLFDVEYNVAPVERDGQPLGAVIEVRDITAKLRTERELRTRAAELSRLADALERSNRELDQFAYVTSHDLKAPLRGIANLSRWIEEDLGDRLDGEAKAHLELLRGRVHRMEALIDAILQYSRIGRVRVKPEVVDVGEMLRQTVDLVSPPPGFLVDIAPEMPTLVAERTPLQQVFLNLLSNSIKHHHRPSEGRVRIRVEDAGAHWRFTVSDDGPGISPRFHEKIFVIFQTLETRDKVEGTGVGLALVKKIVQDQGGSVGVVSDEGKGATFAFTWPKDPPARGDSP